MSITDLRGLRGRHSIARERRGAISGGLLGLLVVGQFEIGCLGRSLRRLRFLVFWGIAKPLPQAPFATSIQFDPLPNVLALGERLLTEDEALAILDTWMTTEFEGGRHAQRIALIDSPFDSAQQG